MKCSRGSSNSHWVAEMKLIGGGMLFIVVYPTTGDVMTMTSDSYWCTSGTCSYQSNEQKGNGIIEYLSLLRDKYSIMTPLRGVCSNGDARTVENP